MISSKMLIDFIYESNPKANDVAMQEATARKRGRPSLTSTAGQSKQRMDCNVPRFVKEPPYEDAYSSFEEDDADADEDGSERRRSRKTLPTYSKAAVRDLFFGQQHQQCPTLERVLFRFQGSYSVLS